MRAVTLYRALLWAYPAPFRREYGREMAGAFDAELADARLEAGWRGTAGTWARALRDLIPTAIREHRHVLIQDLRHAVRILVASPVFTIVAIASLALGIGANTAIFSLLNNVMFTRLPVREPDALVLFTDPEASGVAIGSQTGERSLLTYAEFRELQAHNRTLEAVMAASSSLHRVQARLAGGEPEEIAIRLVSTSYFDTLGVPALIGRTFTGAREPARGSLPMAVIAYDVWQRRFGGRPDVIGKPITLREASFQVIGVAPPWFFGYGRWLRNSFLEDMPGVFVKLGRVRAEDGWLRVDLPAAAARGHHVIGLRATPAGMAPRAFGEHDEPGESEQTKRLRALGYVQ